MSDNFEEAEDIDFEEYKFAPLETKENGEKIYDYTSVENNKIYLFNNKSILEKERPSWIPEINTDYLAWNHWIPICIRDDNDNYYVLSQQKNGTEEVLTGKKIKTHIRFDNVAVYKMSLEVLSATVDYYLKKQRALTNKRFSLPKSIYTMSWSRMNGMLYLMQKFNINAESVQNYIPYNPTETQKDIGFKMWQIILESYKGKKLDMNLQKADFAGTYEKGEETSYGDSGCDESLLNRFGIKFKKQNGKSFNLEEKNKLETTIEKVWFFFGKDILNAEAEKYGLKISYADNVRQHARQSWVGLFSPYFHAIGVSFFNNIESDRLIPDCILAHETAHWLDSLKGQQYSQWYASDRHGTLENKIASAYKKELKIRSDGEKSKIGNAKKKSLGQYWFRSCECFARAIEQDYAIKNNIKIEEKGYLPEDWIKENIQPMVQQWLEENHKYFSVNSEVSEAITKSNPWQNIYPDVVGNVLYENIKDNAELESLRIEAKKGNCEAAVKFVTEVVSIDTIKKLKEISQDAIICPVIAEESNGINKLPLAYGTLLSLYGFNVTNEIIQISRTHHTGANSTTRLLNRSKFTGKVESGKKYILVDDHIDSGATLRDLKEYIESRNGTVAALSVLTYLPQSIKILPSDNNLDKLNIYGDKLDELLRKYDIADNRKHLTNSEITELSGILSDRSRNKFFENDRQRGFIEDCRTLQNEISQKISLQKRTTPVINRLKNLTQLLLEKNILSKELTAIIDAVDYGNELLIFRINSFNKPEYNPKKTIYNENLLIKDIKDILVSALNPDLFSEGVEKMNMNETKQKAVNEMTSDEVRDEIESILDNVKKKYENSFITSGLKTIIKQAAKNDTRLNELFQQFYSTHYTTLEELRKNYNYEKESIKKNENNKLYAVKHPGEYARNLYSNYIYKKVMKALIKEKELNITSAQQSFNFEENSIEVPKSLSGKLSSRNSIWFKNQNKTVKDMIDYLAEINMADFSLKKNEGNSLYIQGYDNGGKTRGRMRIESSEIQYLYNIMTDEQSKMKLQDRFKELTGKELFEEKLSENKDTNKVEELKMENQKYRYYLKNRPVAIGTQPSGFTASFNYEQPGNLQALKEAGFYCHGWVEYDHPLSDKEMNDYELKQSVMQPPLTQEEISTLSENGQFVLNQASNGMLSKYVNSTESYILDDFAVYAARNLTGTQTEKNYFTQMWNLGIKYQLLKELIPVPIPEDVENQALEDYLKELPHCLENGHCEYNAEKKEFYKALEVSLSPLQIRSILRGTKYEYQYGNTKAFLGDNYHALLVTVSEDKKVRLDLLLNISEINPDKPVLKLKISDEINKDFKKAVLTGFFEQIKNLPSYPENPQSKHINGSFVPDFVLDTAESWNQNKQGYEIKDSFIYEQEQKISSVDEKNSHLLKELYKRAERNAIHSIAQEFGETAEEAEDRWNDDSQYDKYAREDMVWGELEKLKWARNYFTPSMCRGYDLESLGLGKGTGINLTINPPNYWFESGFLGLEDEGLNKLGENEALFIQYNKEKLNNSEDYIEGFSVYTMDKALGASRKQQLSFEKSKLLFESHPELQKSIRNAAEESCRIEYEKTIDEYLLNENEKKYMNENTVEVENNSVKEKLTLLRTITNYAGTKYSVWEDLGHLINRCETEAFMELCKKVSQIDIKSCFPDYEGNIYAEQREGYRTLWINKEFENYLKEKSPENYRLALSPFKEVMDKFWEDNEVSKNYYSIHQRERKEIDELDNEKLVEKYKSTPENYEILSRICEKLKDMQEEEKDISYYYRPYEQLKCILSNNSLEKSITDSYDDTYSSEYRKERFKKQVFDYNLSADELFKRIAHKGALLQNEKTTLQSMSEFIRKEIQKRKDFVNLGFDEKENLLEKELLEGHAVYVTVSNENYETKNGKEKYARYLRIIPEKGRYAVFGNRNGSWTKPEKIKELKISNELRNAIKEHKVLDFLEKYDFIPYTYENDMECNERKLNDSFDQTVYDGLIEFYTSSHMASQNKEYHKKLIETYVKKDITFRDVCNILRNSKGVDAYGHDLISVLGTQRDDIIEDITSLISKKHNENLSFTNNSNGLKIYDSFAVHIRPKLYSVSQDVKVYEYGGKKYEIIDGTIYSAGSVSITDKSTFRNNIMFIGKEIGGDEFKLFEAKSKDSISPDGNTFKSLEEAKEYVMYERHPNRIAVSLDWQIEKLQKYLPEEEYLKYKNEPNYWYDEMKRDLLSYSGNFVVLDYLDYDNEELIGESLKEGKLLTFNDMYKKKNSEAEEIKKHSLIIEGTFDIRCESMDNAMKNMRTFAKEEYMQKIRDYGYEFPVIVYEGNEGWENQFSGLVKDKVYEIGEFERITEEHDSSRKRGYYKSYFIVIDKDGEIHDMRYDIGDGFGGFVKRLHHEWDYIDNQLKNNPEYKNLYETREEAEKRHAGQLEWIKTLDNAIERWSKKNMSKDISVPTKWTYQDISKTLSKDEKHAIYKKINDEKERSFTISDVLSDWKEAEKITDEKERNKVLFEIYSTLEDHNHHSLCRGLLDRQFEKIEKEQWNYKDLRSMVPFGFHSIMKKYDFDFDGGMKIHNTSSLTRFEFSLSKDGKNIIAKRTTGDEPSLVKIFNTGDFASTKDYGENIISYSGFEDMLVSLSDADNPWFSKDFITDLFTEFPELKKLADYKGIKIETDATELKFSSATRAISSLNLDTEKMAPQTLHRLTGIKVRDDCDEVLLTAHYYYSNDKIDPESDVHKCIQTKDNMQYGLSLTEFKNGIGIRSYLLHGDEYFIDGNENIPIKAPFICEEAAGKYLQETEGTMYSVRNYIGSKAYLLDNSVIPLEEGCYPNKSKEQMTYYDKNELCYESLQTIINKSPLIDDSFKAGKRYVNDVEILKRFYDEYKENTDAVQINLMQFVKDWGIRNSHDDKPLSIYDIPQLYTTASVLYKELLKIAEKENDLTESELSKEKRLCDSFIKSRTVLSSPCFIYSPSVVLEDFCEKELSGTGLTIDDLRTVEVSLSQMLFNKEPKVSETDILDTVQKSLESIIETDTTVRSIIIDSSTIKKITDFEKDYNKLTDGWNQTNVKSDIAEVVFNQLNKDYPDYCKAALADTKSKFFDAAFIYSYFKAIQESSYSESKGYYLLNLKCLYEIMTGKQSYPVVAVRFSEDANIPNGTIIGIKDFNELIEAEDKLWNSKKDTDKIYLKNVDVNIITESGTYRWDEIIGDGKGGFFKRIKDNSEWNKIIDLSGQKVSSDVTQNLNSKENESEQDMFVQRWYLAEYPDDDLGQSINSALTFKDLERFYNNSSLNNFYELMNVGDSVIRERVFFKLSEIMKVSYDDVYSSWLNETLAPKNEQKQTIIEESGISVITEIPDSIKNSPELFPIFLEDLKNTQMASEILDNGKLKLSYKMGEHLLDSILSSVFKKNPEQYAEQQLENINTRLLNFCIKNKLYEDVERFMKDYSDKKYKADLLDVIDNKANSFHLAAKDKRMLEILEKYTDLDTQRKAGNIPDGNHIMSYKNISMIVPKVNIEYSASGKSLAVQFDNLLNPKDRNFLKSYGIKFNLNTMKYTVPLADVSLKGFKSILKKLYPDDYLLFEENQKNGLYTEKKAGEKEFENSAKNFFQNIKHIAETDKKYKNNLLKIANYLVFKANENERFMMMTKIHGENQYDVMLNLYCDVYQVTKDEAIKKVPQPDFVKSNIANSDKSGLPDNSDRSDRK